MKILFFLFALALRAAEAWERVSAWWSSIDEPTPVTPRPIYFGFCLDCEKPGFVTRHWTCERCSSKSIINVRCGGNEAMRA